MPLWTCYPGEMECGHCAQRIPALAPVLVLAGKFQRCERCAKPLEVDRAQVADARQAIDTARLATFQRTAKLPEPDAEKKPRSFASLAEMAPSIFDDPKARQAGQ